MKYVYTFLAFVGIHCKRHVTTHGLAVNCDVDLTWFDLITPCGLEGLGVTSLTEQLNHHTTTTSAAKPVVKSFCDIFNCTFEEKSTDFLYDMCGIKQ